MLRELRISGCDTGDEGVALLVRGRVGVRVGARANPNTNPNTNPNRNRNPNPNPNPNPSPNPNPNPNANPDPDPDPDQAAGLRERGRLPALRCLYVNAAQVGHG